MTLTFKNFGVVGSGHYPQVVHMMNNDFLVIYVDAKGYVKGYHADPGNGDYSNLSWTNDGRIAADTLVSDITAKKVPHYGAFGFWDAFTDHRFFMYQLPYELTDLLEDGSTQDSIDSPVAQLSMTIKNIKQVVMGSWRSVSGPGSKIQLNFSMGDSSHFNMGNFFVDRVNGKREDFKASISARNTTGKYLKEQTFDESTHWTGPLQAVFGAILQFAGVQHYFVGSNTDGWTVDFQATTAILDGLTAIAALVNWKVDENADGTIGVAPASDSRFDQPNTYTFVRNQTCWSCDITMDDEDSYSRVCVQCDNPSYSLYTDTSGSQPWPLPTHKTLYVTLPTGTSQTRAQSYMNNIQADLSQTGRLESFTGVFTPNMILGDVCIVTEDDGRNYTAGTVTTVEHHFGQSGYYTMFTVDSGGRRGKPLLKDYINSITTQSTAKRSGHTVTIS